MENKSKDGSHPFIILAVFCLTGLGIRLYISWQDFATLFQKCVVDDMMFYLNIAKNIAAGNGATFDGSILTNGFHPVYALLLVPVFKVFPNNPDLTFHLALTILSVFNVLTGVVVFLILREIAGSNAGLTAAFIWLFNPYVIMISLNGVEAGVAAFFISLCIYQYIKMRKEEAFTTKGLVTLGVLTSMAILGRVDAVFVLVSLTLFIFNITRQKKKSLIQSLAEPAIYNTAVFTVLAPWFLWNLYHFGTIRQISGMTLPNISHNMYLMKYNTYLSVSLIKTELFHLKVWIEHIVKFSGGVPLFLLTALIVAWNARKDFSNNIKLLLSKMGIMNFALLSTAMLVSFYALYFWGWLRPWYYLSVMLIATIYLGIIAGHVLRSPAHTASIRTEKGAHVIVLLIVLSFYFMYQGERAWDKGLFPFQRQLYESAVWVNDNTGEDTKIGAISSGVYGYITQRTTDLLGVVNGEAYRAMREKRIFSYMKEKDLDYLVDREDMVRFFSERFDDKGFMDNLLPIKRFGEKTSDVVVYKIIRDD